MRNPSGAAAGNRAGRQRLKGAAVVTGAAGGIGTELALLLAARRVDRLVLVDVDEPSLRSLASRCTRLGVPVAAYPIDVRAEDELTSVAEDLARDRNPVSQLFNVAGVMHVGSLVDSSISDLRRVIDVNLIGTMTVTKAFLPQLAQHPGSRIVNVCSAFGLFGVPGYTAYSASKFALRGFSEALAHEQSGPAAVHVCCAYLGGTRTGIMRSASYADPSQAPTIAHRFDDRVARLSPRDAAQGILRGADSGKACFTVGRDAAAVRLLTRLPRPILDILVLRRFRGTGQATSPGPAA